MKNLLSFVLFVSAIALLLVMTSLLGCSTENPLCTDNYCVEAKVFLRSDLEEGATFDELPDTVSEDKLIKLLTVDVGEYDFEPITVKGKVDWGLRDADWEYREDRITYLKKVTLEFESDEGRFGENRVILVHLNSDTVYWDANFIRHVDYLGTESINLTHHIGMAEYNGDIVGAPTK